MISLLPNKKPTVFLVLFSSKKGPGASF